MISRNARITLAMAVLLASCSGGSGHPSSGAGSQAGDATVTGVASQQIATNTNEIGQPIEVNTLAVTGADTDETSSPKSVN
jgi:hypothetical protein